MSDTTQQDPEASMDQVRDLLFGAQVRQIEDRLKRQEEMVVKRLDTLQEELRESLANIEQKLSARIKDEAHKQGDKNASVDSKINTLKNDIEEKAKSLNDSLSRAEGSLSGLIADSNDQLIAALSEKHQTQTYALDTLNKQLRNDLVSKQALSLFIGELAVKVGETGESDGNAQN
ncbi:hypothetical protein FACS1894103_6080 [Campylobacterota bacterium]|nr:hypothetical protein FACS1894103_6080 [Campylobacterota bacterium]